MIASDEQLPQFFAFVQFDLPFNLPITDGRYIIRRHTDGADVLVLSGPRAGRSRRFGRWKLRSADSTAPLPETGTTATITVAEKFSDKEGAAKWLADRSISVEAAENQVQEALKLLNSALAAHRLASSDPYASELTRNDPVTVRIGYGRGEQIAEGEWSDALEMPAPEDQKGRRKRKQMLDPQTKFAAILSGKETVLLAEELMLRARLDLNSDRPRHAALQADLALEALLAETEQSEEELSEKQQEDLEWLKSNEKKLEGIADSALTGDIEPEAVSVVDDVVARMERFIRRHRYG